jgi:hypothetical protein
MSTINSQANGVTNQHNPLQQKAPFNAYQKEIYAAGLSGIKPLMSTDSSNWEEEAKKVLSATSFNYVSGMYATILMWLGVGIIQSTTLLCINT